MLFIERRKQFFLRFAIKNIYELFTPSLKISFVWAYVRAISQMRQDELRGCK